MDDIQVGLNDHRAQEDSRGLGRSTSAPRERQRDRPRGQQPAAQLGASMLPGRSNRKLVPLGPAWDALPEPAVLLGVPPPEYAAAGEAGLLDQDALAMVPVPLPPIPEVPAHFQGPGLALRVRCYCIGGTFDRTKLQETILRRSSASSVRAYPDVLCSTYNTHRSGRGSDRDPQRDILFFDWGCVVFWDLDTSAERHILREIAEPCLQDPLPVARYERDRLTIVYTASPRTEIEDDALALHYRHAQDMEVKLSVSFALAQSTKLSVYEEEMRRMVKRLSHLPEGLAERGEVPISERDVMRTIGELYKHMAAVNLLGAALDVPDAIDSAPSNIRTLYKAIYEYLEVADRLHLLNDRFGVVRELLELCRTLSQQAHYAHLDTIIMWLVGLCAVIAVAQLVGFLGWRPAWRD